VSGRHTFALAAEVALLAVTVAVVVGMGRLFDGGGWLGQMAASAVAAHATAAVLRRRGVSLLGSAVVMVVVATIVTTWVSYWATTRIGIPTADTWSAMDADLDTAWSTYQEVVAPTPAVRGFVVAACLALWVVAYIADWAAFRLWVPFEATLPASTLFLFTALLGEEAGRGWAVALFAGAVIGFLLLHRLARQDGSSHWVADRRAAGNRSLLIAGSGLGVLAVVAGSVLWPAVPGARSVPLVDVAGIGGSDQVSVLSPLVDIRSRLVQQSDVEMFRVQSPVAAYWRLTSLEAFDGQTWKSRGSFGTADGELPESVLTSVASEEFEQSFTITALAKIWLPSAYEPRALDIDGTKVRYDESSATLIVDNDASAAEPTTSDGLTYQVTSRSPRITPTDLSGTADEVPGRIRDEFLELPEGFSPQVRALAAEIVDDANAATPAQQARALQDYLRNNFEYSLDRQDGHSEDALEDFLFVNQVGYCEQFAGSYAAMARSLGIPARVAVGFTPGDRDADAADTFVVRGEYAHAWPEVYIAGAGWVAYEPTPGRGMPGAEPYTDVPEQQAEAGNPGGSEETPTTAPLPTLPTASTTPPAPREGPNDDIATGGQGPEDDSSPDSVPERYVLQPIRRVLPILAGLAVVYLVVVPLGMVLRRRRRRQRATSPLEQVDLAWTEAVEAAALAGFEERASDTYVERALRLGEAVPGAADAALTLAARLEVGVYSAEGAEPDDAAVAWEAAGAIEAAAIEQASRLERFRRWFDPRRLVRSWRRDRAARQRRITMTPRADLEAERELVGSDDRG
jgi:transglutaminase-like putative cysteine protease